MSLNFQRGLGLKSDLIRLRSGWDGSEPRQVDRRFVNTPSYAHRFTVAINTFYPEIAGGYYLNRFIISWIQDVLQALGVHVIAKEYFEVNLVLPIECGGGLEVEELYVLANQIRPIGSLQLWAFGTGGGSAFYKDAMVMDFGFSEFAVDTFAEALEKQGHEKGVSVETWPTKQMVQP